MSPIKANYILTIKYIKHDVNSAMKFSFVIPTYMEKDFIEGCINAVLAQHYPRKEFEIIVSDANSKDGTIELAKRLADKVVITEKRGISIGRNLGAREAKGEILVFIDADVVLHSAFLSNMEKSFTNRTVGVMGSWIPVDGIFSQKIFFYFTRILIDIFSILGIYLYPGIAVAYKRKEFLKCGGFREDFGIVEDLDMSRRISRMGKCKTNKKALSFISTRRLQKNTFSMVAFHVYNDLLYIFAGRASKHYPKSEELKSWRDIWRINR